MKEQHCGSQTSNEMDKHRHTSDLFKFVGMLINCAKANGYGEVKNISHRDRIRNHNRDRRNSNGSRVEPKQCLDK